MSVNGMDRKEILNRIRNNQLTPEQGFQLIRQLEKSNTSSDTTIGSQEGTTSNFARPVHSQSVLSEDIAIIGVTGRFPDADNVQRFWENLSRGVDSVREIPKERWDIDNYYDPDIKAKQKTYCRMGGTLAKADRFDALFFNISPREAELMDPQQRVFLEESWKAFEDAGYSPNRLSNAKVGVFVGVTQGDYDRRVRESEMYMDTQSLTGMQISMLSARISYFLNLTGPCISTDTACSSSLVAVSQACQSIHNGDCDMALAGGVHILTTPDMYIMTSKGAMLSREGKCKAFDNTADGFVPGEGIGIVILKQLSKAIEDKDNIYAVIKGSRVNQDGKTNGITAPSISSQYQLEKEVYSTYGINPETISYVEAHGTGTKLGDPIEFTALTKAFRDYTKRKNYCAMGSVKTNIGHSLTASGVTGLIKVILCMQHKKLVPSLHYNNTNEHIHLEDSPFYINTELQNWLTDDGIPRRAAISSFGLSGTNCHMVIEEVAKNNYDMGQTCLPYYLIPFSAESQNSLHNMYVNMLDEIDRNSPNIADIAYTLSTGRCQLSLRSYMIVQDISQLRVKLEKIIAVGIYDQETYNNVKENPCIEDEETQHIIDRLIDELSEIDIRDNERYGEQLLNLGDLYIKGYDIHFYRMYHKMNCQRISLPTYVFDGDSYWIESQKADDSASNYSRHMLHPLLGHNTSNFQEQKYSTTLTGEEFYMTQHVIKNKMVLPGVAYLEMARVACELASDNKVLQMKGIVWMTPISIMNEQVDVNIALYPMDKYVDYEVTTTNANERTVHGKGKLIVDVPIEISDEKMDIDDIKTRCTTYRKGDEYYQLFHSLGVDYGRGFQVIEEMYSNSTECLSMLELPALASKQLCSYVLHPSIMDGALQTVIGLRGEDQQDNQAYLPYSIDEMELLRPIEKRCYVHVKYAEDSRENTKVKCFHINIMDEKGRVAVRIKNYLPVPINNRSKKKTEDSHKPELLYYKNIWKKKKIEISTDKQTQVQGTTLLFATHNRDVTQLKERIEGSMYVVRAGKAYQEDHSEYTINPHNQQDYEQLFESLNKKSSIPTNIIYMWANGKFDYEQQKLQMELDKSAYSLLYLSKVLLKQKPKENIKLLFIYEGEEDNPVYAATAGFAKTMHIENPGFFYKTVHLDNALDIWNIIINELAVYVEDVTVRYIEGNRYAKSIIECHHNQDEQVDIQEKGTYIITGGAGGLGIIFAKHLANYKANLVLIGRSALSEEKNHTLDQLRNMGAEVTYIQGDITNKQDVIRIVSKTKVVYGNINGIIHSAGVIKDSYALTKTKEEMAQVLAPKVSGLIQLDHMTCHEKLDFFIVFSSMGAITGNVGQCDYAYANSFMDSYMTVRETLGAQGKRFGKSLSINWPLWKNGGMGVDEKSESILRKKWGMTPLTTAHGIEGFNYGLTIEGTQLIVIEGLADEIRDRLDDNNQKILTDTNSSSNELIMNDDELYNKTLKYLRYIMADVIKLKPEKIYAKEDFESYGIDSVMIVSLNEAFEEVFGEISKTLFFEYKNLNALTHHFIENLRDKLLDIPEINDASTEHDYHALREKTTIIHKNRTKSRYISNHSETRDVINPIDNGDIAIIGVSGRYPMSRNIEHFWQNLKNGKDCITEIPKERWDYTEHYCLDKNERGTYYSKWGGFIDGVNQFDPLFFKIAPREAEMIDPQERLFLEVAWQTVENAGYSRDSLTAYRTGVFVGAMFGHYQMYGAEEMCKGNPIGLSSSFSSIANRVSYYFDLHGPSMAVDTMCSSSLTSIHLACQSIKNGECDMALAGGVNVSIHPNKYIMLAQGKFLSSDGRCRSFGEGGDGYVPGEGVGAVMLKSLKKAKEDGDYIYTVIKATRVNHGGKTNGYTVPNPIAQGYVITDALDNASIKPETLSYIEAHGTGTSLGDPIEIKGLMNAYGQSIKDKTLCAIGSVKSNIGHLESAAGIAAITKVLLMMKYRKLVPSLHSAKLNPNINMKKTPFHVQQITEEWKQPILEVDGICKSYPRRAGISSFGAGGSNAHIIMEEYENPLPKDYSTTSDKMIMVLSANNKERLSYYVKEVEEYVTLLIDSLHEGKEHLLSEHIEDDIREWVSYILNVDSDDLIENVEIVEYGLDTIQAVELIRQINNKYLTNLNVKLLYELGTIQDIAEYIITRNIAESNNHLGNSIGVNRRTTRETVILQSMAYTLQRRESLKERVAIVTSSLADYKNKLNVYLNEKLDQDIYMGTIKLQQEERHQEDKLDIHVENWNPHELASLWIGGSIVEWKRLYEGNLPIKMPIPSCPFIKKTYWYTSFTKKSTIQETPSMRPKKENITAHTRNNVIMNHNQVHNDTGNNPVADSHIINDIELDNMMNRALNSYTGDEVTLKIIDGNIAIITLQDKKNRNVFSMEIMDGLMAKFAEIKNNNKIKVAIVTGYDSVFCMGGTQEQLHSIADQKNSFTDMPFLYKGLLKANIPVISAMQGHSSGGGMLFGMYADIVMMAEESVYSAVFTKYGFTPGMGATFILKEKLGNNLATEMMFTAKAFSGEELRDRGASIVFRKRSDVLTQAVNTARLLAEKPRHTLNILKRELADRMLQQLDEYIKREDNMHKLTFSHPEVKKRIKKYYRKDSAKVSKVVEGNQEATMQGKATQIENEFNEELHMKILSELEQGLITPEQAFMLTKC